LFQRREPIESEMIPPSNAAGLLIEHFRSAPFKLDFTNMERAAQKELRYSSPQEGKATNTALGASNLYKLGFLQLQCMTSQYPSPEGRETSACDKMQLLLFGG